MKKQNTIKEEEDIHLNPLAPYQKSDEFVTIKPFTPPNHKKSSKCLVYVLLILVFLSILFLIFGLIVLRIKTPNIQISSVAIENLRRESSQDLASLNMTIVAEIRMHNQNFGRFKIHDGNTILMYENATIGATDISGGRIERRERKRMNVTVEVMWAGNVSYSSGIYRNFSRDIDLGLVKLRNYAKLRGEVRVVKIVNRHRTAIMNCSMAINLTSGSVHDLSCQ